MRIKADPRGNRQTLAMGWTYHPELLATPVPRYTSFPTAAEFGGDVGPEDMVKAIGGIAGRAAISLYVPIPNTTPYIRTVAAALDPYRQQPSRAFSNAI